MANSNTELERFVAAEVERYKGVSVPIRAWLPERIFIRKIACGKLHPNPLDEFCDPDIGPEHSIISAYEKQIAFGMLHTRVDPIEDPLIVEKMHPGGYMILNGHHRWAAAMRRHLKKVPVRVVNVTHEKDIRSMLENAKHDRRATLDLDELVFAQDGALPVEKPLPFPFRLLFRQRLRLGVPAVFHFLKTQGYDIWVYSSKYYSMEYIRRYLRLCHAPVDGIVTGTARGKRLSADKKAQLRALAANRYSVTLHIDERALLRTHGAGEGFEEFRLTGRAEDWSAQVIDIIREMDKP
ncbi:MAG: transcriptional regulator [Clostridiales bacterium]|nr:transcriptional regulator [Clostridiales bacterium]